MVVAYRETPEDRALTSAFRVYNGQQIDIRWSGGWLTPRGVYHPVDYKNGITHETLAQEHGRKIRGSGSIMTRPPIMRIFDVARWMRITYLEPSTFCVELKGKFRDKKRQRAILQFVSDYQQFDSYFINDVQHNTYLDFVAAIRADKVRPTKGRK